MSVVPPGVSPIFKRAGWFEGRRVAVDAAVPSQHPAHAVLAELGGIVLRAPAPNIRSMAFRHVDDAAPDVVPWEAVLATKLVGIAEQDGGHAVLHLTGRGQLIGCSLVHDACWLVGRSLDDALQSIIEGRRSKPMMLPDQQEVTLYGTRFRRGDNQVVGPTDLA